MIYLIDDNQGDQRKRFQGIDYVDSGAFSDCLVHIEQLKFGRSLADMSHLAFLETASCILLHDNTEDIDINGKFMTSSRTNITKIKDSLAGFGRKIPAVIFSNGITGRPIFNFEHNPNLIEGMFKNTFYERLLPFLNYYREKSEVELRILAFGENFLAEEVSQYVDVLLKPLNFSKAGDLLRPSDISSLNTLRRLIVLADLQNEFDHIVEEIEDSKISIELFKKRITKIRESFISHGKNIHNWN